MIEYGSEYHFPIKMVPNLDSNKLMRKEIFIGSGRDAIRIIIEYGKIFRNWKRIWVPIYICPEVMNTIIESGIVVEKYIDYPLLNDNTILNINYKKGDVLFRVNYFGLNRYCKNNLLPREKIEIIEDHSHSLNSVVADGSDADYCVASIRKLFPVPDGGIIWSPKKHDLPLEPQIAHCHYLATLEKFTGMLLKGLYLENERIDKKYYLSLLKSSEEKICQKEISGIYEYSKIIYKEINIKYYNEKKKENYTTFCNEMKNCKDVHVIRPENDDLIPFSCICVFNSPYLRNITIKRLIVMDIYPAILWSNISSFCKDLKALEFSETMMSIHCDIRYSKEDMQFIARTIKNIIAEIK